VTPTTSRWLSIHEQVVDGEADVAGVVLGHDVALVLGEQHLDTAGAEQVDEGVLLAVDAVGGVIEVSFPGMC
jgi:hypothetical protein